MKGIQTVGVVGAGTMGRGILQLFAQAGVTVWVFDAQKGAAAQALDYALGMIAKSVEKGRMTAQAFAHVQASVHAASAMADLAACDVVIEAIVEDLEVKRRLFHELEEIVRDTALLATNTSSLTVADIASACKHPQRVAGLHFFNPVPLMKVAEVIAAVRTSDATVAALREITERSGHRAVVVSDQPGFLINHAGRGLYTEGLRIVEERVASPADVDDVLRDAMGFRMGPFELLDLSGLDVSARVMSSIYEQFQHEPRFRPSTLVPPRVAAGLYGRKSGEGWYRYEDGKKVASPAPQRREPIPGAKVWLEPASERAGWHALFDAAGAVEVADPAQADLCIVQPWGKDATTAAREHGLDARRCVGVDPLPPFALRRTLMLTTVTSAAVRDVAMGLLGVDGVPVTTINDSHGFICQIGRAHV